MRNMLVVLVVVVVVVVDVISAKYHDGVGRDIHVIKKRSYASYRTRSSYGKPRMVMVQFKR